MNKPLLGVMAAVGLHGVVFLFGGMLIPKGEHVEKKKVVLQDVDLSKKEEKKIEEPKEKLEDPVEDVKQEMPDFRELAQPSAPGPALAAVSLSDLGSALSGIGGDSGFGNAVGFGSGVIGGSGSGGFGGAADMLSSGQLDSKPQATSRVAPQLPKSQHAKGVVQVLLVVGPDGSVSKADVVDSPDPAVNAACVEAARQWRFQPGTRGGKPVSFKLKLPFRFE